MKEIDIKYLDQESVEAVRGLLQTQRYGVLITQGVTYPHGSLVAFAHTNDLKHVFFATSTVTRKFDNIRQMPNCTMMVDNRSNLEHDLYKTICVIIKGTTRKLDKKNCQSFSDMYLEKHGHLRSFYDSPSTAFMDLTVHKIELVSRFQNVVIVNMKDA